MVSTYKKQKEALKPIFEKMCILQYLGPENHFYQVNEELRNLVSSAIDSLEPKEKYLIEGQSLQENRVMDSEMCRQMGINSAELTMIRRSAFNKLAIQLGIDEQAENDEEDAI